jgi:hypothetical protein
LYKKINLYCKYLKIVIWPNGKSADNCFIITITSTINSLKRLKDCILNHLDIQLSYEKIKIYDYKEIEIDDSDIIYLNDKQTLYVSLDGKKYYYLNYN